MKTGGRLKIVTLDAAHLIMRALDNLFHALLALRVALKRICSRFALIPCPEVSQGHSSTIAAVHRIQRGRLRMPYRAINSRKTNLELCLKRRTMGLQMSCSSGTGALRQNLRSAKSEDISSSGGSLFPWSFLNPFVNCCVVLLISDLLFCS